MVRLKEFLECHIILLIYISIPYGAIKSGVKQGAQAPLFIFQFLMVRLKDRISFSRIFPICISIPYGAIKSDFQVSALTLKSNFNSLWCD